MKLPLCGPSFAWVCVVLAVAPVLSAAEVQLVVCAPGFPGSTAEAQPAMDDLARVLGDAAGWTAGDLGAVYFEDEAAGVESLERASAAIALVTLPFFIEQAASFGLRPLAQAAPVGAGSNESWTLLAGAGRVAGSSDLAGWQIVSIAGYAPSFVRGVVFDGWGVEPEGLEIVFSNRVLTALRRAAKGEKVAVLLDGQQAQALGGLPFADDLEVVRVSEPLPASLLCSVGERLQPDGVKDLVEASLTLDDDEAAADALAGVRLEGFVPLDQEALTRATSMFDRTRE